MDGLAAVADDDILHDPPDRVVENRHAQKREPVRPGHENRADNDQRDSCPPVEVLLKVKLIVIAGGAAIDDRVLRRRDDRGRRTAMLADAGWLAGLADEPPFTCTAEKVD